VWQWLLGAAVLWWAPEAFFFRERPGGPDAHRASPEGPWIMQPTLRYRVLWTARCITLALATFGGLLFGWLAPFVGGRPNVADILWTGILLAFLGDAFINTIRAHFGHVQLHPWGVLVRRPLRSIRIEWSEVRLIKRFSALDGFAILRQGKPPVLMSIEFHGLARFVGELVAHAPAAAYASNLSRFPAPLIASGQVAERAG